MKRFLVIVAIVLLAACGGSPAPAAPAPTAAPLPSGALGLLRTDWEATHGLGRAMPGGFGQNYDGTIVSYQNDPSGAETAWLIEQQWAPDDVRTYDAARSAAQRLAPQDSTFIRTFEQNDRTIDLYHSEWLKNRFPATFKIKDTEMSYWLGGEPGDFTVLYRADADGRVTSFVISIGNNP